jgi:hypothetical protein
MQPIERCSPQHTQKVGGSAAAWARFIGARWPVKDVVGLELSLPIQRCRLPQGRTDTQCLQVSWDEPHEYRTEGFGSNLQCQAALLT